MAMKLYTGFSPNGTRVTAFLAEKGIDLPIEPVDVAAGETRTEAFLKINPLGQIPVLELDDGRILTETVAICRYLEHLYPKNPLMGKAGDEAAFIEMWNRRMELLLFNAAGDVVVHSHEMFRPMLTQIPEFAAKRQADLNTRLTWLDGEMADGRPFVAGEHFTVADITGMAMFLLMGFCQMPVPDRLSHVQRWQAAICSRPSFPVIPS